MFEQGEKHTMFDRDPQYATRWDIVGESPVYGGVPHCGDYDCMDYEDECRLCGRSIRSGATICNRHPFQREDRS